MVRHIDLTFKDPGGIADHGPGSIHGPHLDDDIDAAPYRFNAYTASGTYVTYTGWSPYLFLDLGETYRQTTGRPGTGVQYFPVYSFAFAGQPGGPNNFKLASQMGVTGLGNLYHEVTNLGPLPTRYLRIAIGCIIRP